MLTASQPVIATQVSAMTLFVFNEYISTMSQSNNINLYESIQRAAIVVITFIVVWSLVILIVPLKSYIYTAAENINKEFLFKKKIGLAPVVPCADETTISPEKSVREYLYKYLPIIYHEDVKYLTRIVKQITVKHFYYDFLTSSDKEKDLSSRYLNAFKILTHISVILLIIYTNITTNINTSVLCFFWQCYSIFNFQMMMVVVMIKLTRYLV